MKLQVVIICGGLATRLGHLTADRPKSMVTIHGKPFLEYQLAMLKDQGIKDIVLCTGHLGDQIEEYFGNGKRFGVSLKYSIEKALLGTAGALKNASPVLQDLFFTMYGDSYLMLDFTEIREFFLRYNALGLMTVYRNEGRYDISNTTVSGEWVSSYEKNCESGEMVYIDYGASLLRKEALSFVPEGVNYPLESLFHTLIEQHDLLAWEVKTRFYEIGSVSGINEFSDYISAKGTR